MKLVTTCALILIYGLPAAALEYQAQESVRVKVPNSPVTMKRLVRVRAKKVRRESQSKDGQAIQIFDFESRKSWLFVQNQTFLLKMDCKDEVAELLTSPLQGRVVGNETIRGVLCEKRKNGNKLFWISAGIIRRLEVANDGAHPTLYDYESVDSKPQPSKLFEVPSGYRELKN